MNIAPAAMVLAAGKGTRLGKLGQQQAKAMLEINGQPLIAHVLGRLVQTGVRRCVINLHHLGKQIEEFVGDGSAFGIAVAYSREPALLDVAGGIANALPLLGTAPFIVVNVDIVTDYDLSNLVALTSTFNDRDAHLVLGSNPDFRRDGDFSLHEGKITQRTGTPVHTYIGTAMYSPALFANIPAGQAAPMMPLWLAAIARSSITGEHFAGHWFDVGTPAQLAQAINHG